MKCNRCDLTSGQLAENVCPDCWKIEATDWRKQATSLRAERDEAREKIREIETALFGLVHTASPAMPDVWRDRVAEILRTIAPDEEG